MCICTAFHTCMGPRSLGFDKPGRAGYPNCCMALSPWFSY